MHLTNVVLVAAGDRVVQRWIVRGTHTGGDLFGVPAAGASLILTGINEFRIENGKIAERWGTMDVLGMLQQLGIVPDPMHSPPPDDADITETRESKSYAMSDEELNLGYRSHTEVMHDGLLDVVDEIYAPNAIVYSRQIPPPMRRGTEGFKSYVQMLRAGVPDMEIVHESVVTEGQYQGIGWSSTGTHSGTLFGIPATGKKVAVSGYDILAIQDGKIVEAWIEQDMLGMMQQLGLAP